MKHVVFFILLLITAQAQSQEIPVGPDSTLWEIERLIEDEKIKEAVDLSDKTFEQKHLKDEPASWYMRGVAYLLLELSGDSRQNDGLSNLSIAQRSFGKALSLDPDDDLYLAIEDQVKAANYYLLMEGANRFNKNAFGPALESFELGIAWKLMIDEIDTLGHYNAGLAAERAGDTTRAMRHYRKCIDHNYEALNSTYFLIHLLSASNQTKEMEKLIDRAQEEFPGYADRFELEPFLNVYRSAMENGEKDKAYDALVDAREALPENYRVYMYMARFMVEEKDSIEGAMEIIDQGLEATAGEANLQYLKGTLYESQGELRKAIKQFKKATAQNPEFGDAWYNIGAIWYSKGHDENMKNEEGEGPSRKARRYFKKARPYLEKAYEIQPDDLATVRALHNVYYQLDETDLEKKFRIKLQDLTKDQ